MNLYIDFWGNRIINKDKNNLRLSLKLWELPLPYVLGENFDSAVELVGVSEKQAKRHFFKI